MSYTLTHYASRAKAQFIVGALFICLVCFCTSCKSKAHDPALPPSIGGTKWLSLSQDQRNQYIAGYLAGYGFGFNAACEFIQKLELRYPPEDKNETHEPSYRCFKNRPEYTKTKWLSNGDLDVSFYSGIITELYEKHPDARSAPFVLLLGLMNDGGANDSEQLYTAQLNQWPNARVE